MDGRAVAIGELAFATVEHRHLAVFLAALVVVAGRRNDVAVAEDRGAVGGLDAQFDLEEPGFVGSFVWLGLGGGGERRGRGVER